MKYLNLFFHHDCHVQGSNNVSYQANVQIVLRPSPTSLMPLTISLVGIWLPLSDWWGKVHPQRMSIIKWGHCRASTIQVKHCDVFQIQNMLIFFVTVFWYVSIIILFFFLTGSQRQRHTWRVFFSMWTLWNLNAA